LPTRANFADSSVSEPKICWSSIFSSGEPPPWFQLEAWSRIGRAVRPSLILSPHW
jgi:hypothetical protein